jgi:hypothetical protein
MFLLKTPCRSLSTTAVALSELFQSRKASSMFKFGFLFVLASLAGVASCAGSQLLVSSDSTSPVAVAISQIVNHIFSRESSEIDIGVHGKNTSKLETIADDIGKSIQVPHKRRKKPNLKYETVFIERSAILLFNKWEDYHHVYFQSFLTKRYQSDPFLLIYIDDDPANKDYPEETMRFMGISWSFFLDYFLEVTKTSIILSTFDRFQQSDCHKINRFKVNEFSLATRKWESEKFVVDKFRNLNQCKVLFNMMYPQSLALQVDFDATKKPSYRGYVTKFNDIISKKMNFTFTFNPVRMVLRNDSVTRYEMTNYSYNSDYYNSDYHVYSLRKLSMLEWNETEVLKIAFKLQNDVIVTKGFVKVDVIIVVSGFKSYSMVEKVFLPFEAEVWWCLIGFLSGLAVIASVILVFASKRVRNFVFGLKVKSPLLNMM